MNMHTTENQQAPQANLFASADTTAEEERRQRRAKAAGTRSAAYELLRLSERDRAAMEWACTKRTLPVLRDVRAFFDEAEALDDDQQVAAWLNGPLFRGAGVDSLRTAIAKAVGGHLDWQRSVRRAILAERIATWFLGLFMGAFLLVSATYAILH